MKNVFKRFYPYISFLFLFYHLDTNLFAQTAVYFDWNTRCYGVCWGNSDVKNCAYNQCRQCGGQNPYIVLDVKEKGYGALYEGFDEYGNRVIGHSAGYRTLSEAKANADGACLNAGSVKVCTLKKTWHDEPEIEIENRPNGKWTTIDVENMFVNGKSVAACINIKGDNILTLERIQIRDNGEHSWRDPAALGIQILLSDDLENWYTANSLPLIGLHNEGPEEKGNCQGYAKLEWYDNEAIKYLNYGIFNWDSWQDYTYIRFRITEGDHENDPNWKFNAGRKAIKYTPLRWVPGVRSALEDDIVFDVYDKTENLKNGSIIKVESNNIENGATMWLQTKSNY